MWWVRDRPGGRPGTEGMYHASGAYGQFITVLPALDMVIAHKTAVPPERQTTSGEYFEVVTRVMLAR